MSGDREALRRLTELRDHLANKEVMAMEALGGAYRFIIGSEVIIEEDKDLMVQFGFDHWPSQMKTIGEIHNTLLSVTEQLDRVAKGTSDVWIEDDGNLTVGEVAS